MAHKIYIKENVNGEEPGTSLYWNIVSPVKHSGDGMMVWEGFSGKGMGPLVYSTCGWKMNYQDYTVLEF